MKLKELESELGAVDVFDQPKVQFEQYPTSAHLAARMLFTAESVYGDICGKSVADLGMGCGMLTIASIMLGSEYNVGFEIDPDAINVAQANLEKLEMDECVDIINADLSQHISLRALTASAPAYKGPGRRKPPDNGAFAFDTVLMNPPFGTKKAGIDVVFLQQAVQIGRVVYSLHKSSTRDYLAKKARSWGCNFEVLAQLKFDIPQMYKFHKKKSVDVMVDLIRISH